jgi:hypothetical protein
MSGATVIWTLLIELALLPFAIRERMRMKAASKPRYAGQRNLWPDGRRGAR